MDKLILINKMKEIFCKVPYGVEHTLRVLAYAEEIMQYENITQYQREVITITAIMHDIGAIEALRKYGDMGGEHQEIEGPNVARRILKELRLNPELIERVCFIIGNHHTPSKIDGIDFQIQWEADLIDNIKYTNTHKDTESLLQLIKDNVKTSTGTNIAYRELMVSRL
ncbi:HD domain-containing protein [Dendrosporobacter sp. 1207_IL3150]|uniref:HD domain-containing protein n=1 Tax=Dendrosporobacter sp. 1207_IL3150 TaxID=3084054 RepID=UPI002FDA4D5D